MGIARNADMRTARSINMGMARGTDMKTARSTDMRTTRSSYMETARSIDMGTSRSIVNIVIMEYRKCIIGLPRMGIHNRIKNSYDTTAQLTIYKDATHGIQLKEETNPRYSLDFGSKTHRTQTTDTL